MATQALQAVELRTRAQCRLSIASPFKRKCHMDQVTLRLTRFRASRVRNRCAYILLCLGYDPDSPEHVAKDRLVGAILHIGRSGFPLEWLKDEDGFAMTTDMMTQGDLGAFRARWKALTRRLGFPLIVDRAVDRVFQELPPRLWSGSSGGENLGSKPTSMSLSG
jgi:hypothetical protein